MPTGPVMNAETLIVVAAYDDTFRHNLETFRGGDVEVVDTSGGGHPSAAFINTYRKRFYKSYLFIQDSIRGTVEDVVSPFKAKEAPVVAWGSFPLFFDSEEQERWVARKLSPPWPDYGIFGPIFYATRKALKKVEDRGLFPDTPPNKIMAQGTERAWAISFYKAGIPVEFLGPCVNDGVTPRLFPEHPVFEKTFAART